MAMEERERAGAARATRREEHRVYGAVRDEAEASMVCWTCVAWRGVAPVRASGDRYWLPYVG